MAFKINKVGEEEFVTIRLRDYPNAFKAKCEEYVEQGLAKTMEDAKDVLYDCMIDLEIMYEKGEGLLGIESGALESHIDAYSPYTAELGEYPHVCPNCGSEHVRGFFDADCDDLAHSDYSGWGCAMCGHTGDESEFFD